MIIYEPTKKRSSSDVRSSRSARPSRVVIPKVRVPRLSVPALLVGRPAVVVGVAALVLIGTYVSWSSLAHRQHTANKTSTRQKVTTTAYLTPADRTSGRRTNISLTAPTSWHLGSDEGKQVKILNTRDVLVSHFAFKPEAPGGHADGDMVLETIGGWLGAAEQPGVYGGLASPAQKLAYANFLTDLRKAKTVSAADSVKIITLNNQVGGVHGATYVESADGKLSGVVFESVISIKGGYQPVVIAYMAGMLDDQPAYLRGVVTYQDQIYSELYGNGTTPDAGRVQAAFERFRSGQVDNGMEQLAGHWRDMLHTMAIDTSGRQSGQTDSLH